MEAGLGSDEKGLNERNMVQSVERALSVLEILAEEGDPMPITEIARIAELKVSTVHRLLATLMARNFVEQESNGSRYKLSLKFFTLAQASVYPVDLRAKAHPYLEELVERCNETANLSVLDGREVVYVDQVESTNIVIVRMSSTVGSRRQIHCTGSGKVLLAHLPAEDRERILSAAELKYYTDSTITDADVLREELENIRRIGYALDNGERVRDMRCVAAPLFSHDGKVVAAISVSGPSTRMAPEYIQNVLVKTVTDVAAKLSRELGYNAR